MNQFRKIIWQWESEYDNELTSESQQEITMFMPDHYRSVMIDFLTTIYRLNISNGVLTPSLLICLKIRTHIDDDLQAVDDWIHSIPTS